MGDKIYDLIAVGTGFATSFFLHEYLRHAGPRARVLVLERGRRHSHSWYFQNPKDSAKRSIAQIQNETPKKKWRYLLDFGGSSNCWWACTPRMLPEDFELQSRYGHGEDWPLRYDDLEEFYSQAEQLMSISGPSDDSPFPRSRPYPQPPHRFSDADRIFKQRYPAEFFVMPTARARRAVPGKRPACCAHTTCTQCPIGAKFTIQNSMRHVFEDPRVELKLDSEVTDLDVANDVVRSVQYRNESGQHRVSADFVALGANAIFNTHLLLRSGVRHPKLGRGLTEQMGVLVDFYLDGVDNFQGSTSLTGHGYMLYSGNQRKQGAAALMETSNIPTLRNERGKWRQILRAKFVYEDLRLEENSVTLSKDEEKPSITFARHSDYAMAGFAALPDALNRLCSGLPISEIRIADKPKNTEAHIIGTTVMGSDPAGSVVDATLVHHRIRNLAVLGSGAFPTAAPANPTLTLSALSLRSANRLWGSTRS